MKKLGLLLSLILLIGIIPFWYIPLVSASPAVHWTNEPKRQGTIYVKPGQEFSLHFYAENTGDYSPESYVTVLTNSSNLEILSGYSSVGSNVALHRPGDSVWYADGHQGPCPGYLLDAYGNLPSGSEIGADVKFVANTPGVYRIYWRAAFYDSQTSDYVRDPDILWPSDPLGYEAYYINVVVTGGKPDLVVSYLDVSPTNLNAGDEITVSFKIKNQGDADVAADSIKVNVYLTGPQYQAITYKSISPLPAGQESSLITVSAKIPVYMPNGNYNLVVEVDPYNNIEESNEDNNKAVEDITISSKPDLVPEITSLSKDHVQPGDSITVNGKVNNEGSATAGASTLAIFITDGYANGYKELLTTTRISSLSPGSSESYSVTVTIPDDVNFKYNSGYIEAVADYNREVDEANEDDNYAFKSIYILSKSLKIVSLNIPSGTYYYGDTVKGTITIKNTGDVTVKAYPLVDLEHDSYIESVYPDSGSVYLDPGESYTWSISWRINSGIPAGYYDVVAYAYDITDPDNKEVLDTLTKQDWIYISGAEEITLANDNVDMNSTVTLNLIEWAGNGLGLLTGNETNSTILDPTRKIWFGYTKHSGDVYVNGYLKAVGISSASLVSVFTPKNSGQYIPEIQYLIERSYLSTRYSIEFSDAGSQVVGGYNIMVIDLNTSETLINQTRIFWNINNPEYFTGEDDTFCIVSGFFKLINHEIKEKIKNKVELETGKLIAKQLIKKGMDVGDAIDVAAPWAEKAGLVFQSIMAGLEIGKTWWEINHPIQHFDESPLPFKDDFTEIYLNKEHTYLVIIQPFVRDVTAACGLVGASGAGSYSGLYFDFDYIKFHPVGVGDVTPPKITFTNYPTSPVPTKSPVSISWSATDDATPSSQLQYSWRMDGYDSEWSSWSTQTSVSYQFPKGGTYIFEIRAKDSSGNIAYNSVPIQVSPNVNFTITALYDEGNDSIISKAQEEVYLTIKNIGSDGGVAVVYPATTKGLNITPDFSQIHLDPGEAKTIVFTVSVKPDASSQESVLFAVYDNSTGKKMDLKTLDLAINLPINAPPVARFVYTPTNPHVGDSVTLDASASYDPDGTIVKYEWDFDGDGTWDATGKIVTHTYSQAGTYTVRLRVTDNDGATDITTKTVEVSTTDKPPVVQIVSPSNQTTLKQGQNLLVSAKIQDDVGLSKVEVWLDGPGETLLDSITSPGNPYMYHETFNTSSWTTGQHKIYIVAYDAKNQRTITYVTFTITPKDIPPTIEFISPKPYQHFIQGEPIPVNVSSSDDIGIAYVELYLDGSSTPIQNWTSAPYEYTITQNLSVGEHTLKAVAVDTAGQKNETTNNFLR